MRNVRASLAILAATLAASCAQLAPLLAGQAPRAQKFRALRMERSHNSAVAEVGSVYDCVAVGADGTFRKERQISPVQPIGDWGLTANVTYTDVYEGKLALADLNALLAAIDNEGFNAVQTQPRSVSGGEGDEITIQIQRAAGSQGLQFWGDGFRKKYKANLKPLFAWWASFEKQKLVRSKTVQLTRCPFPALDSPDTHRQPDASGTRRQPFSTARIPQLKRRGPCPVTANSAPAYNDQPRTATLYSAILYKDHRRASFNFERGQFGTRTAPADLSYGTLSVGDDWDWFAPGRSYGWRGSIRDLGLKSWSDPIQVPALHVYSELTEQEIRKEKPPWITVDASAGRYESWREQAERDGIFTRAFAGHMYLLHVKDSCVDYYVLLRVESIERGENCTISWRRIPPPQTSGKP